VNRLFKRTMKDTVGRVAAPKHIRPTLRSVMAAPFAAIILISAIALFPLGSFCV